MSQTPATSPTTATSAPAAPPPRELPWPRPAMAWWAIAVFFGAAVLSYTDRQILTLLIDPLRAELAISDTQVSLLQGIAFALIYSVAGLPLGRAADLFARRGVIIAGVATWSLATLACAYAHSFEALFVARVFVGVGEACLAPAASPSCSAAPCSRRSSRAWWPACRCCATCRPGARCWR